MRKLELSEEQSKLLHHIYYDQKILVGRDKLHKYIQQNHPDSGISRAQIMNFLRAQPSWQLTKRPPKRVHISLMDVVKKPGYMSCDLTTDLPRDKGYNHIFGIIDVASRKLYCKPLKTKTAKDTTEALKAIIRENPDMKLTVLRVDGGSEFKQEFAQYLQEIGVKLIISEKAAPWRQRIERAWSFLKSMLHKNQLATGSKAWVKILPKLVDNMNNVVNQSTKMTPNQVEESGLPLQVNIDRSKKYGVMKRFLSNKSALKVGDMVRIRLRPTGKFVKSKTYWSEDVYFVVKVLHQTNTRVVTYKVSKDLINVEKQSYNITELLYVPPGTKDLDQDLDKPNLSPEEAAVGERTVHDQREIDALLINQPEVAVIRETRQPKPDAEGYFEVEKILAKRKFGKTIKYLVKWKGYKQSESSWESVKNIRAPALMREFRERERLKKNTRKK
jgi:hypothetical protein